MVDLGGYWLENNQGDGTTPQAGVFPAGLMVERGATVIITRNCTRAEFETYWEVTLPANTVFMVNGSNTGGVPVINGGERWRIHDPSDAAVDGFTVAGEAGKSYRRRSATTASSMAAWDVGSDYFGYPGHTELGPDDHGVLVSQWSDATGTGNWIYEFVEIYVNP